MEIAYKLNKKIKDDNFIVEELGKYNLLFQLNQFLFRVCITDSESNRCLLLEDYILEGVTTSEELLEQLNLIFENHEVLKANFWKSIRMAFKDLDFSLIPRSLFDKKHLSDYLHINCGTESSEKKDIYYYIQNSSESVSVFSAEKTIVDWFQRQYPGKIITKLHHTSAFIEGVFQEKKSNNTSLFVNTEKNFLTILAKSERGLEFCNSFYYSGVEDFVYFVLFVYHQLGLNPESTPLTLFGEINPDSQCYKQLFKYISEVNFGDKPSSMSFGYRFDEVFDHRFFDLYCMHFCRQAFQL